MFGRQKTANVVVEISDTSRLLLESLDNDIQALAGMVDELVSTHGKILGALRDEIVVAASEAADNGVVVFADDVQDDDRSPDEPITDREIRLPKAMQMTEYNSSVGDDRIRDTPFTRAPRTTQVRWLRREVMQDGGWYNAVGIARLVANDERHYRYLRHAIGGRLREMHEDGMAERRSSRVPGVMFEYRLKEAVQ